MNEPGGGGMARRVAGEARLEAVAITKDFATLRANDHVNFSIKPGEIHALLGENGAGKSTLVKILYGALQPTSGEIRWKGEPVTIANPAAARKLGIGMVFQHFSLFEALTVAENIALALTDAPSVAGLKKKITAVSAEYGLPLNPDSVIADLSVGERQRVEIVRCLLQEPDLIIMDEPTSVLTPQEADDLFVTLKRLASEGVSVLYISHRLEEVRAICHHATILRHGKVVAECDPANETSARLASLMVGAELHRITAPPSVGADATVRLKVDDLSLPKPHQFAVGLYNVSLEVRAGEIVSIAGVAGNGQDEFFDALSGERAANPRGSDRHRRQGRRPPPRQRPAQAQRGVRAGGAPWPRRRAANAAVAERRAHPPRHGRGAGQFHDRQLRGRPRHRQSRHRDLRRAQGDARPGRRLAFRRQPSEIRGRARVRPQARRIRRLPANVGR